MELSDYLHIMERRKWIIILSALVAMILISVGSLLFPPKYKASAVLRMELSRHGDASYPELIYADRLMATYVEIATSSPVLTEARAALGLDSDRPSSVKVETIPDTELLRIDVEDQDRFLASDMANTLATILVDKGKFADSRVYVIDPASTPKVPSVSRNMLMVVLFLLMGGVAGLGLAFLVENLDPRLYTTDQIEAVAGTHVIGEIPFTKHWPKGKYPIKRLQQEDAFRRLRNKIFSLAQEAPLSTIIVTSAQPQEGKSTVALNLACSIARSGHTVVIVDADFHRPTIHNLAKLTNDIGLSDVLEQKIPLFSAVRDSPVPGVHVLTSGQSHVHPSELFDSDKMVNILEQLKSQFDIVLVDTPAFLGVSDAAMLMPLVDGILLVARCGYVRKDALHVIHKQMGHVEHKVMGVVANRLKKSVSSNYSHYYHQTEIVHGGAEESVKAKDTGTPLQARQATLNLPNKETVSHARLEVKLPFLKRANGMFSFRGWRKPKQ